MKSKLQNELKILKTFTETDGIKLLINQIETLLLEEDNLELRVKRFVRDCYSLAKGLNLLLKDNQLNDVDKKIQKDAFYLYNQLIFLI